MCHSWLTPVGARTGSKRIKKHPLKKIPTEANLRWDFHLYVFSDIYLTSTFLDVPSLILTTLMPF